MAERLEVRVLDDNGQQTGQVLGWMRRDQDNRITTGGLVAGELLEDLAFRWRLDEGMTFSLLARNGWTNSRLTLVPEG